MRKIFAIIASIVLLLLGWFPAHAQQDELYFQETGHYVRGEFHRFYTSNPNALILYGYPITEQVTSKDGKTAQYFQRARFELRDGKVTLTPLGRETYTPRESLEVKNAFACRTFSETGFSVCFSFLEFFDKYGGAAQFGYPISGFEYHENKLVQYFENTRLEWHPWKPEGQRVVVSDLGRVYFDKLKEDPALLAPAIISDRVKNTTKLQVRAFPWKAVTLANDTQIFYIILQNQNSQPVENATCTTVVHWPNGSSNSSIVKTNTNGVAIVTHTFTNQPYGSLIYIDINCSYNGLTATTTTSFRIWY